MHSQVCGQRQQRHGCSPTQETRSEAHTHIARISALGQTTLIAHKVTTEAIYKDSDVMPVNTIHHRVSVDVQNQFSRSSLPYVLQLITANEYAQTQ